MDKLAPITLREELTIALRIARLRLRGQMAYRASFIMQILGNFLTNVAEIIALFIMFYRFDDLGGWSLYEVALLHGMSMVAFSLADSLTIGLDNVSTMIRAGEFDRILLRPISSWINAAVSEVSIRHFGQLAQGLLVLIWSMFMVDVSWSIGSLLLLLGAILTGVILFIALFTVEAILCFWTVNGIEAINAFTYGGSDLAQFPMHIFPRWMRFTFVWLIPVAFVTYYPALEILGKKDPLGGPPWMIALGPVVTLVFCAIVTFGWRQGIRHYRSTGS